MRLRLPTLPASWRFWRRSSYARAGEPTTSVWRRRWLAALGVVAGVYALGVLALGWWWSYEPGLFDPVAVAKTRAEQQGAKPVIGYTTAATLAELADVLLEKRGGYLSNDLLPPGVYLDNTPNWEFGVLVHLRVLSRAMRNDFSRSQSQSAEDPDLAVAQGFFFYDNGSWIFPRTEDEYSGGAERVRGYAGRLADPQVQAAQFYARADNLAHWLDEVSVRLGDVSQRLSQSVGKRQLNVDLAGEPSAAMATEVPGEAELRTGWFEIDDVFYEARGQAYALVHMLKAVAHDFRGVLEDKNALVSLEQIIRELEATQQPIFSPMVLNGDGFGFLANHSLVMASYVSRVNAALIDLRDLLDKG